MKKSVEVTTVSIEVKVLRVNKDRFTIAAFDQIEEVKWSEVSAISDIENRKWLGVVYRKHPSRNAHGHIRYAIGYVNGKLFKVMLGVTMDDSTADRASWKEFRNEALSLDQVYIAV